MMLIKVTKNFSAERFFASKSFAIHSFYLLISNSNPLSEHEMITMALFDFVSIRNHRKYCLAIEEIGTEYDRYKNKKCSE